MDQSAQVAEETRAKRVPGEEGIWIFVLGDMIVFALFFAIFLYYRALDPELFNAAQATLNKHYGAINTLLLLSSSLFVACAMQNLREDRSRPAFRLLQLAFLCGVGFSVIKIIEYGEKFAAGVNLMTNDFFLYYFILTGVHFFHLILGMFVLAFMMLRARSYRHGETNLFSIEAGGIYWHMVDLLWIVLFPLIYLVQ